MKQDLGWEAAARFTGPKTIFTLPSTWRMRRNTILQFVAEQEINPRLWPESYEAKQRLCKQATDQPPVLGNSSVDVLSSPSKRRRAIMEETLSVRSVSEMYTRDTYSGVDTFRPVSFTDSAWERVYATKLSERETSKRHVGEAHSVLITAILLPQRLSCYWGRIVSLRMLTNLGLADLRLTTAQQRTTGQNLQSGLYFSWFSARVKAGWNSWESQEAT
jgi:hypothetical protein